MKIRTEIWNGHEIRFVERASGEWWAVLADIADAMNLSAKRINERLPKEVVSKYPIAGLLKKIEAGDLPPSFFYGSSSDDLKAVIAKLLFPTLGILATMGMR